MYCKALNCDRNAQYIKKQLCGKHYMREVRLGSANASVKEIEKHGMTNTPEYKAYNDMKNRCYREKTLYYHIYGGRGIKVCERWLNSFTAFYEDMGARPSAKHSIDRIDNNGDYSPENCKWSTIEEQQNNKRTNTPITYRGRTQTVAQWARELGVKFVTLDGRLKRYGWSVEEAFNIPVKRGGNMKLRRGH